MIKGKYSYFEIKGKYSYFEKYTPIQRQQRTERKALERGDVVKIKFQNDGPRELKKAIRLARKSHKVKTVPWIYLTAKDGHLIVSSGDDRLLAQVSIPVEVLELGSYAVDYRRIAQGFSQHQTGAGNPEWISDTLLEIKPTWQTFATEPPIVFNDVRSGVMATIDFDTMKNHVNTCSVWGDAPWGVRPSDCVWRSADGRIAATNDHYSTRGQGVVVGDGDVAVSGEYVGSIPSPVAEHMNGLGSVETSGAVTRFEPFIREGPRLSFLARGLPTSNTAAMFWRSLEKHEIGVEFSIVRPDTSTSTAYEIESFRLDRKYVDRAFDFLGTENADVRVVVEASAVIFSSSARSSEIAIMALRK